MRVRLLFIISLFLSAFTLTLDVSGQTYSYRSYDNLTGLPGNYVYSVCQDKQGLLWIGLETGLFRHDGFSFFKVSLPDTLTTGYANSIYCDNSGTMWIGFTDGSLFTASPGKSLIRQTEITADKIEKILPDAAGNTWIVSQSNGLFLFEKDATTKPKCVPVPEGIGTLDLAFISPDTLLMAAEDNLHLCTFNGDSLKVVYTFPDLEYQWVQSLAKLCINKWVAGTDGGGLFIIQRRNDGYFAHHISGSESLENARVKELLNGDDCTLFIATRESGVVKATFNPDYSDIISEQDYNMASGLGEDDVKTIYRDREGNLWIGLFSKGLAAVTTNAFSFFKPSPNKEIRFIGALGSKIIMGNRSGIYDFNISRGQFENFRNLSERMGGATITSWHSTSDGFQWIGTDGDGIFRINTDGSVRSFFKASNPGQNKINSIDSDSRYLWLATFDGVVVVDRSSGKIKAQYSTLDMLPHNKILQVVVTGEGTAIVATESEKLCYISLEKGFYTGGEDMKGYMKNIIQSVSVSPNDNSISVGTLGNGLFRLRGDTLLSVTEQEGLLSNYCYSVLDASDGRIWTGHEKGFSIWDPDEGMIRTYDREFGVTGDCLPNALFESKDGTIFIGTTDGVIVFDPKLEKRSTAAPEANILSVRIGNTDHPWQSQYTLPYKKDYSIEIKYAGVNLSDPLNVVYRTQLENYDEELSQPTGDRIKTYKQLRDGHYRFVVLTASKDNPSLTSRASFDLVINKPIIRTWWFRFLILALAALAVVVIIKIRDRAHRKQEAYLEEELVKRTREVHEQKEELYQKNLDITESIKYAKRIQSSVLPDIARLGAVFNDAFVFFAPRDIVSGDFYWFDWIDKDRFIIVCADSTGHGVPGAFMSMIGTALLQDIITRKRIVKPSAILRELDRQIFSTLNQNQEVEAANDGMDIVVCEFNVRDRHLTFASAMRPVILVIDGEQQYVRGNRSSIGGESVSEKFFDDQEYYLREGDVVYLFSDGYPDQFGGPSNKKMKISRLRTLIDEIKDLPMEQQHQRLRDFFYDWKGSFDQVDDVMLMGIKV